MPTIEEHALALRGRQIARAVLEATEVGVARLAWAEQEQQRVADILGVIAPYRTPPPHATRWVLRGYRATLFAVLRGASIYDEETKP